MMAGVGGIPFSVANKAGPQHESLKHTDPFMSSDGRQVMEIVFFVALSGGISIVGSIANVINIIVFFKQGLSDSVNISLLGLATSDLGALLTLLWMSVCFNPLFRYSEIDFDSSEVQYLTAGWPHVCFARITSWVTAFVTFERCVCIAVPLKVATIITPKRTCVTVLSIYIFMFANAVPVFSSLRFVSSFRWEYNRSVYGLFYGDNVLEIENRSFAVTVFAQLSSFIIVIVCTVVLIQHLLAKSQWRLRATLSVKSAAQSSTSSRDKRVIKMVTFISCIFICCFLPSTVNLVLMVHLSPDYSVVGRYQNSFEVSWSILNTIEAANSSVNILVYYNMSSKFRAGLNQLCGCTKVTVKDI
ncbi:hypothetical protein BsWGS_13052 [Bradybaena similaris]